MKPPIPRVFADIGRTLIEDEEPDGNTVLVLKGIRLQAVHFKQACALYHGIDLESLQRSVRAVRDRRAAGGSG